MMRGLIIVGIWVAVVTALAAPQRVFGDTTLPANGNAATQVPGEPVDPVILEPIRPLFPDETDAFAQARDCGSSDVLMMSPVAGLILMLNVASNRRARRAT